VQHHVAQAQDLVSEVPASPSKARVLSNVARYLMLAGESDAAVSAGRQALAMAELLGLDELKAYALNYIGSARSNAGGGRGVDDLERSVEIARAANSSELARAYNNLAHVLLWHQGKPQRSFEVRQEAVRVAERFGASMMERFARGVLVSHAYWSGRWDDHVSEGDAFLAESERIGVNYQDTYIRIWRVPILLARGHDREAVALADVAVAAARTAADPQVLAPALTEFARLHAELGDLARAREAALEALRFSNPWPELFCTLGFVADRIDVEAELAAHIEGARRENGWVAGALAMLDGDFVRAAEIFTDMELPAYDAWARRRAAEQLAAAGRRTEADEQLRRALKFWLSVGAARYVREAETLLRVPA
jgi:tetratricopeptide (TPR) repeat protein